MRNEKLSTANYTAVIADLRSKRDELDRVIETLEAMSQVNVRLSPSDAPIASSDDSSSPKPKFVYVNHDAARSSGIGERCAHILRERIGQSLSTRQVTDLLIASGFELKSENPTNNVWSALSHRAKTVGDVQRIGKVWQFIDKKVVADQSEEEPRLINGTSAPSL